MVSDQMGKMTLYEAFDFEIIFFREGFQVSRMNGCQKMPARSSVPRAGPRWLASSWISGTRTRELIGRILRYVI